MNYARLLLLSLIIFGSLSITTVVILSQSSTRQVGVANCEIYTEGSGVRCARIRCDTNGYTVPGQGGNHGCTPTHPAQQSQLHCESRGGSNCEVTTQVSCNLDSRGASFGRTCTLEDGTIIFSTVQSPQITCPVTCPGCPTPSGNKPCRQAVWNTTYCKWDRSPCDVAQCLSGLNTLGEKFREGDSSNLCNGCNADPNEVILCQQSGGTYDYIICECPQSPIIIDVSGNGFNLTSLENGIVFDINGDGRSDRIAWSSADSDDAWLALDRNNNGLVDNGLELFGNSTSQPAPPAGEARNGFLALAVFDELTNGGNVDGKINYQDAIFTELRLWQDVNHNGISEANELKTLSELGLATLDLDYKSSRRTDEHGNKFKYRAKVKDVQGAQIGRWAWDVFLRTQQIDN